MCPSHVHLVSILWTQVIYVTRDSELSRKCLAVIFDSPQPQTPKGVRDVGICRKAENGVTIGYEYADHVE